MAFHDLVFPKEVRSLSASPLWPVDVIKLGGGGEQRILIQPDALREFEAVYSTWTIAEARAALGFFNGRRAMLHSFKVRDKMFYERTLEPLGIAGASGTTMQLIVDEGDSLNSWIREIYLPEPGSVQIRANNNILVEGTNYSLNYNGVNGGKLTWITSVLGQTITATFKFFVPVRFDVQSLPDLEVILWRSNNTGAVTGSTIPMREVDYAGEWI